jgi:hypothetical protein
MTGFELNDEEDLPGWGGPLFLLRWVGCVWGVVVRVGMETCGCFKKNVKLRVSLQ